MNSISSRLKALRKEMVNQKVEAYLIPSADPHQSEYVPEHWAHRSWISGFTGSAGTAVVTIKQAGLWTDSRYFLQAEHQLKGTGFKLQKLMVQTQAEYLEWLGNHLTKGLTVGCDFRCFSYNQIMAFHNLLTSKGLKLKDTGDLVGGLRKDRPELSVEPIYEHPLKYAGQSREDKLKSLRVEMKHAGADFCLLAALDEIAHLTNLRGQDVHCNPVFVAYMLVGMKSAQLYVLDGKANTVIKNKLNKAGIKIVNYHKLERDLGKLPKSAKILFDPSSLNAKLVLRLNPKQLLPQPSPVMIMKAVKNPIEREHIRNVMLKDGIALVKAFRWLEHKLEAGERIPEDVFARELAKFRSQQKLYVGESFDAIIGYNANGAIIHYRPEAGSSAKIKNKGILLVDSGGQYMDGTTDITRTIALSKPSLAVKKRYTAVLMGHIALADAVFPEGTKGIQLDALARQYLWRLGLNYGHGTGHGVGFFMNVHEPPQGFVSAWNQRGQSEMKDGMLTSNEPGFYEEGAYGIRIENLVLNRLHVEMNGNRFLSFETVTLFPIDTQLIHTPMLNKQSLDWINAYHSEVYAKLSVHLDPQERQWLREKCMAI